MAKTNSGEGTVVVSKKMIKDLLRAKEEYEARIESLELMADEEFMESYRKAKEEIKRRELGDWDELVKKLKL